MVQPRPCWEPPVLDNSEYVDEKSAMSQQLRKRDERHYPVEDYVAWEDALIEDDLMNKYCDWIRDETESAASEGDGERMAFFGGLQKEMGPDHLSVQNGFTYQDVKMGLKDFARLQQESADLVQNVKIPDSPAKDDNSERVYLVLSIGLLFNEVKYEDLHTRFGGYVKTTLNLDTKSMLFCCNEFGHRSKGYLPGAWAPRQDDKNEVDPPWYKKRAHELLEGGALSEYVVRVVAGEVQDELLLLQLESMHRMTPLLHEYLEKYDRARFLVDKRYHFLLGNESDDDGLDADGSDTDEDEYQDAQPPKSPQGPSNNAGQAGSVTSSSDYQPARRADSEPPRKKPRFLPPAPAGP